MRQRETIFILLKALAISCLDPTTEGNKVGFHREIVAADA